MTDDIEKNTLREINETIISDSAIRIRRVITEKYNKRKDLMLSFLIKNFSELKNIIK